MSTERLDIEGEISLIDELKKFQQELKDTSKDFSALQDEVKKSGNGIEREINKQTKALNEEEKQVEELKREFIELNKTQKTALNPKNVNNTSKSFGGLRTSVKGFGAALKSALLPLLALTGITEVFRFIGSATDAYREQEKAVTKVRQAIESTGGAASRSTSELIKQSEELQNTTLFGDEEILNNVTAQLLTFTNIANEQFDRTQKVALDLATVLDGDLQSASIQLGKALNDPVANLSALSRSGIQFSQSQQSTIKTLANTNRLAEAQSVILEELERQYGGQAEAAAIADGGYKQLQNSFGDLSETIGKGAANTFEPIIFFLKDVVQGFNEFFSSSNGYSQAFTNIFNSLRPLSDAIGNAVRSLGLFNGEGPRTIEVVNFIANAFKVGLIPISLFINAITLAINTVTVAVNQIKQLSNDFLNTDFATNSNLGFDTIAEDFQRFGTIVEEGMDFTELEKDLDSVSDTLDGFNSNLSKQNEITEAELKKRVKLQQDFNKSLEGLLKEADNIQIESLTGTARIEAEEDAQLAQIDLIEEGLLKKAAAIGASEEQINQITEASEQLRIEVLVKGSKQRIELREQENQETKALSLQEIENIKAQEELILEESRNTFSTQEGFETFKAQRLLEIQRDYLESQLAILSSSGDATDAQISQLKLQILNVTNELQSLTDSVEFSGIDGFYSKLFGLEDQGEIDAVKQQIGQLTNSLLSAANSGIENQINQQQQIIDATASNIDELEDKIASAEEDRRNGYANNVEALRASLRLEKAEQDKALAEQEKLRKKQIALDTAIQASAIITSTAQILAAESTKGLVGIITAGAAIASLFALFKSAQSQANAATQLEKGASGDSQGIIRGKRHYKGGERFTDNIEVESGEAWAVLNRSASKKFGKEMHDSFAMWNKGVSPFSNLSESIALNMPAISKSNISTSKMEALMKEGNRLMKKNSQRGQSLVTYSDGRFDYRQKGINIKKVRRE